MGRDKAFKDNAKITKQIQCPVCEQVAIGISENISTAKVFDEEQLLEQISQFCQQGPFGSYLLEWKKWGLQKEGSSHVLLPPDKNSDYEDEEENSERYKVL